MQHITITHGRIAAPAAYQPRAADLVARLTATPDDLLLAAPGCGLSVQRAMEIYLEIDCFCVQHGLTPAA